MGRVLKVDHTRYKRKDEEEEMQREQALRGQKDVKNAEITARQVSEDEGEVQKRPLLREEKELAALIQDHDEDDPMKEYLVQEKKAEVAKALAALTKKKQKSVDRKKHHRHHHHRHDRHRSRNQSDDSDSDGGRRRKQRAQRRSRSPR